MVESLSEFPFRKLRYETYLTLNVMMHVDCAEVYKFMFSLNKEARKFLQDKFITVRNEFVNEGLITYEVKHDFMHYQQLENLYFQALKRIPVNRVITLQVSIRDQEDLTLFNEAVRWINAQQQQIKLQFKVDLDDYGDSLEKLSEFLNSIKIIELYERSRNENDFSLNQTVSHSIRCLKISTDTIINLQWFKSLQILSISVSIEDISRVIPYLASKFNRDHFRRMQINLNLDRYYSAIEDQNLDQQVGILPKHIQIDSPEDFSIYLYEIKVILETFEGASSIVSFNEFKVIINSSSDFELLETLTSKAQKVSIIVQDDSQNLMKECDAANFQSVTDHLTIAAYSEIIIPLQLVNIFKNIKSLDIMAAFEFQEMTQKINLPQLQSLNLRNTMQLGIFTGLKLLTNIGVFHWDEMIDLDDIFDPSKILALQIRASINAPQVLSLFTNLRSLKFANAIANEDQIYQFLPHLKALRSLKFIYRQKETLFQFHNISKDIRSLATFEIQQDLFYLRPNEGCIELIESIIQQIRQNQFQRSSPLTLIFSRHPISEAEVRIMKMLEQESFLSQQLQLQFAYVRKEVVKTVISEIDQLTYPILHQFLSMKAAIYDSQSDDDN